MKILGRFKVFEREFKTYKVDEEMEGQITRVEVNVICTAV